MVEIKEPNVDREYYTSRAKEVRTIDPKIRYPNARKCKELELAKNCKITTEKKLSREEAKFYEQEIAREKERYERYIKRNDKRTRVIKSRQNMSPKNGR